MAEKTSFRVVVPIEHDGDIICSVCAAKMMPWDFTSFPSLRKNILWRCANDPDHITTMLPLPKENND